jgi:acyl carrier protein
MTKKADCANWSDGEDMETQTIAPAESIREQLIGFIVANFLFCDDSRSPADDDSLIENGIIDSTGILELIEFIESSFGIEVREDETLPENLDSVTKLVTFVLRKNSTQ